jgi:hypothetical protein
MEVGPLRTIFGFLYVRSGDVDDGDERQDNRRLIDTRFHVSQNQARLSFHVVLDSVRLRVVATRIARSLVVINTL